MADSSARPGLFPVNIARVRESLNSLADEIEFIASGQADDVRHDYDAWDHRVNAGRQLVRLRAALNDGELDRADCALDTLAMLRRVRQALKELEYGSHHNQPEQYCGPLFLPGELSDEGLHHRNSNEPYDPNSELLSPWVQRALSAGGLPYQPEFITTRERWGSMPSELRKLSARLARPAEFVDGSKAAPPVGNEVLRRLGEAECVLPIPNDWDGRVDTLPGVQEHGYLIDQIILGPTPAAGNRFPISNFDCIAVAGETPTICPNADRKPQENWLSDIERRFRELRLVGDGQTIHWVGSQSKAGNVCACFRNAKAEPKSTAGAPIVPSVPQAGTPKAGRAKVSRTKPRATVNARMLDRITKDPACQSFSCQKWADALGCSKSSVAVTKAWKELEKLRAQTKAELELAKAKKRR